ncbi:adenosylcobinamide amidohydrolase [Brevibacillus laterosporus]|uniref:Adenosylcobinamide amidohydrolase n=1 Tax=Brevibacillus laterosporus TaxID=1465 RepID=A0AAP8QB33_BRELA|nr:adenosylcobinamide amidohydrolase [Brevibacillus laterosporus]MED1666066.1 adenosylcobinamide amidohydrolase [Brevibacillus laterosporus]MED1667847.1 adenosylcobinamide amidohydrolase [Brevibacillus laterosporus]MED1719636.1 adenosylcobinamide amidohydrolase [Brevibacillus laterosporus]PPA89953.1 adenosylcobinamide amidohydrolase [Brevibacillus laterosporus]PPA93466.1 adenosylcobinamide amidohydrolase [Brevibacillus laterosporus]
MQFIEDWYLDVNKERVLISYPKGFRACSSAAFGGGISEAKWILNQYVGKGYLSDNPQEDIREFVLQNRAIPEQTIGLLTAACVEDLGISTLKGDEFELCAVVTTGIGNAVRAGTVEQRYNAYAAGTINTVVFIDGNLTDGALINAVITATEAKTIALAEMGISDGEGRCATGTTTDAIVVAATCNQSRYQSVHPYAGTATNLGHAIACAVRDATRMALTHEQNRKERRSAE